LGEIAEGFLDSERFFLHVVCSLGFWWFWGREWPVTVLLVADLLHPVGVLAVDLFLDRYVRH